MLPIGHLLKKIRQAKHLSQKEVAEGILSEHHLSKCELEKSDMSTSSFLEILNRLNVSLAEFEIYYSKEIDTQQQFIDALFDSNDDIYILNHMLEKEKRLYQQTRHLRHYHNQILLRAMIAHISQTPLNRSELRELHVYLLQVEDWGRYELALFNYASLFFTTATVHQYVPLLFKKAHLYRTKKTYMEQLSMILLNILYADIEHQEIQWAHEVLDTLEEVLHHQQLFFCTNKKNFLKGLLLIQNHQGNEGRLLCEKAIQLFYEMDEAPMAREHRKVLDEYMTKYGRG